jgi:hypothetical protein
MRKRIDQVIYLCQDCRIARPSHNLAAHLGWYRNAFGYTELSFAIGVTISDRRLGYGGLIFKMPKTQDQQDFSKMDIFFQKWISFWARHGSTREGQICSELLAVTRRLSDSISDNVWEAVMCRSAKITSG